MMRNCCVIFVVLVLSLVVLVMPTAAAQLYVDNEQVEFDLAPAEIDESCLIPLDQLTDDFSMDVVRLSDEQLFVYYDDRYVIFTLGNREAQLNNEFITLEAIPVEVNGHYLVPLGFICDFLDVNYSTRDGGIQFPIPIQIKGLVAEVLLQDKIVNNWEKFNVHLLLKNTSAVKQTLQFNSGQRFDFIIKDQKGRIVYRWSQGKMFVQTTSKVTLNPNQSMLFSGVLELRNMKPGLYELYGIVTSRNEVSSEPVKIVVRQN